MIDWIKHLPKPMQGIITVVIVIALLLGLIILFI